MPGKGQVIWRDISVMSTPVSLFFRIRVQDRFLPSSCKRQGVVVDGEVASKSSALWTSFRQPSLRSWSLMYASWTVPLGMSKSIAMPPTGNWTFSSRKPMPRGRPEQCEIGRRREIQGDSAILEARTRTS